MDEAVSLCQVARMKVPFAASLASLTLRMATIASTLSLLQEVGILPTTATCSSCLTSVGSYKTNNNYHYFECGKCHHKTSILHNTILSNSNTKPREMVLLMYQFSDHHKTYQTVTKETFLPQSGYKETHLSCKTITKWFSYFRYLCMEDAKNNVVKIGGPDDVVEMDETMCGKMKYGKGDPRTRRRQWLFGGKSRNSGRTFMALCPENKRTRKALWPIVQAFVEPGTTLHTDGWRAYRRLPELNYLHRWVNHSKYYVSPLDRKLHTNGIEGMWGVFKHWLPQAGRYNLEEYMWLFNWIQDKKMRNIDPFWALMELVKADNNCETLKRVVAKADAEATTEAVQYHPKSPEEDEDKDDEEEDRESDEEYSDEEDQEIYYFFDCIGCKNIFREKADLYKHIPKCDKL